MKTLINVFHPKLEQSTVNRLWAQRLEGLPDVTVRRVYSLYPDGKIDVAAEQTALLAHDRLVFQHPFFWYSVPPLMKQWFDDVLTYNWAYGPTGKALAGKEWVSSISTGGPADSYQAGGYNSYSMSEFLKPLQQTANLIQTKFLPPFISTAQSAQTKRQSGSLPTIWRRISLTRCLTRRKNSPRCWRKCRKTALRWNSRRALRRQLENRFRLLFGFQTAFRVCVGCVPQGTHAVCRCSGTGGGSDIVSACVAEPHTLR